MSPTLAAGLVVTFVCAGAAFGLLGSQGAPPARTPAAMAASAVRLPLAFEANGGRTDPRVRFLARGEGYTMFFTDRDAVFSLRGTGNRAAVVRTRLVGSSGAAAVTGGGLLPGHINS